VIPGSGPDGHIVVKTLNMLLCGVIFVALAQWARKITVTTQTTITDLVHLIVHGPPSPSDGTGDEEGVSLTKSAAPIGGNNVSGRAIGCAGILSWSPFVSNSCFVLLE